MAHVGLWNHYSILSWTPPELLILEDEFAVAFSGERLPNSTCCTMNHRSILTWTPPERLMLDYGIKTLFSRDLPLNSSCWTMESSQHSLVSSSWIAHVGVWITTALSHEPFLNEWLILDYGIITTLSRKFRRNEWLMLDYLFIGERSRNPLLKGSCWTTNHHSILKWTHPE